MKNNALFSSDNDRKDQEITSIGTSKRILEKEPSDKEKEIKADCEDYFNPMADAFGGFRGVTDLKKINQMKEMFSSIMPSSDSETDHV